MFDKPVRPGDALDGKLHVGVLQCLQNGTTETAHRDIVFQRHEQWHRGGVLEEQPGVERLDEAGVHHRGVQPLLAFEAGGEREGVLHPRAERPESEIGAGAEQLRLAGGQRGGLLLDLHARAGTARVADEARSIVLQRGVQHVGEFVLVLRLQERRVRHIAQERKVEEPVVGRPVVGREAGAVQTEDHRQLLQADVVHDLVVGALEKRGIDRDHRPQSLRREAGGEQRGMFLRDADIEELPRQLPGEQRQTGPTRHRAGDADHARIQLRLAHQGAAEDVLVIG